MPAPDISIVVATYNRVDVLCETLKRISRQTLPADQFEVIVSDDGSTDGTGEDVARLMPSLPYRLTYLHHENRGPGYSQNRAIRVAAAPIVLLMPDDVQPLPTLLAEHLLGHRQFPAPCWAVLGKVVQSPELTPTMMHRHWNPFRYDTLEGKTELEAVHFLACNISVKKEFLLKNGMFREHGGAAHEDIELGYRLGLCGLRIFYRPAALAHHHHEETLDSACCRAFERGRNFTVLTASIPPELAYPLYKLFTPAAGIRACLRMLPRELLRLLFFNALTVPFLWCSVLRRSDRNKLFGLFASNAAYRGVTGHFFRKGFRCSAPLDLKQDNKSKGSCGKPCDGGIT